MALRIFLTLPVTVAGAERVFSSLSRINNFSRSTMEQERLCGLTTLAMESDLAQKIDFCEIIEEFANKKARKKTFRKIKVRQTHFSRKGRR